MRERESARARARAHSVALMNMVFCNEKSNVFVVLDICSGNVTPPTKTDY